MAGKDKNNFTFTVKDIREFYLCIEDLLCSDAVKQMKQYVQHGDTSTLSHCMVVAFRSYMFCKKWNLDYRAAARGGLLHDLFLYDWHDKEARGSLHGFHHPSIALNNADRFFALEKKEREIIKKHMWPLTVVPPKCREAYVIAYYDKVCTSKEVVSQWAVGMKEIVKLSRHIPKGV